MFLIKPNMMKSRVHRVGEDVKKNRIPSSSIAQGALTIALIVVFFLFFKGVTNIINAFLVPLTLFIYSINKRNSETILLYFAVFIICALFFNLQVFFIVFYCLIAVLLKILLTKKINTLLSAAILSIANAVSFWVAIRLTDYIFLTQMGNIMLKLFNDSLYTYALVLLVEGMIVGVSQLFISRAVYRRILKSASFDRAA